MTTQIVLGIASGGSPTQPFLDALAKLRLPHGIAPLARSVVQGNFIPAQRELIMRDAIAGNYDYLFFVDDDIVLPEHALEALVESAEQDPRSAVVGGLYYSRDSVRPIAVADWSSRDTSRAHIPGFTSTDTAIVDGVGFGCALLRVSVARALSAPYFPAHIFIERRARRVRQCDEDYRYCERVRESGHHVRLDARVRCDHYDRASNTTAPARWEDDDVTREPRMIVAVGETTRLVPFDPTVPRAAEEHLAADLIYISVDG